MNYNQTNQLEVGKWYFVKYTYICSGLGEVTTIVLSKCTQINGDCGVFNYVHPFERHWGKLYYLNYPVFIHYSRATPYQGKMKKSGFLGLWGELEPVDKPLKADKHF